MHCHLQFMGLTSKPWLKKMESWISATLSLPITSARILAVIHLMYFDRLYVIVLLIFTWIKVASRKLTETIRANIICV